MADDAGSAETGACRAVAQDPVRARAPRHQRVLPPHQDVGRRRRQIPSLGFGSSLPGLGIVSVVLHSQVP